MSQGRELLRAIAREPGDDAVRLVYADWLEESGQGERAEFVRGQVRLAGMAEDSPARRELAFRCRVLLDQHEAAWAGPLDEPCPERHWSRGFLGVLGLDPQTLERFREGVFDTLPTRRLILTGLDNKADALALIPPDHRLAALELIDCGLDLRGLRRVAAWPDLGRLTELSLMFNRLQDSAVEFLCQHPSFQRLSLLRLAYNPFTLHGRDRLHAHFGVRVSFAQERFADRLYAIGENYWYGWGDGHVQLLAGGTDLLVFDHAGNLLRSEALGMPYVGPEDDERLVARGYRPKLIRVKRFRFMDGVGVSDFPHNVGAFDDRRHPRHVLVRDLIGDWLERGNFQVDFGGDRFWFDRDGVETSR